MSLGDKDVNIGFVAPASDISEMAKTADNVSKKKFVFITKTILSESSSAIEWCHPSSRKRFVTTATIDFIDPFDSDFMSPELGKLCEKFLKFL